MADLEGLYRESKAHLQNRLLPFWTRLRDDARGGFYGVVTDDLMVHREADKGCVLNSRILWFFAEAYRTLHKEAALEQARHAFHFLKGVFLDKENGGLYWSVTATGAPSDTSKHCYCQAFGIYALAAYARAEVVNSALAIRDGNLDDGAADALKIAYELFDLIETKMRDEQGYLEEFSRNLTPAVNNKLSGYGVVAQRTMNTTLHLLEAYTELYLADGAPAVRSRIESILDLFLDKVYIPEKTRLGVFFDADWNSLLDIYSYGHDIEAAWLIDRALSAIGSYPREKEARRMTMALTAAIYARAYREDEGFASLPYECVSGVDRTNRVWWVQTEALIGFLNGVQTSMADGDTVTGLKYADAVGKLWAFIRADFIDPREDGEWFSELDEAGVADRRKPVVDLWKCPYHNGRMCMEIMHRINKEDDMEEVSESAHPGWRRTNWQPPEEVVEPVALHAGAAPAFSERYIIEKDKQERLLRRKNEPVDEYNGIFTRYEHPILTRDHVPLFWRYDLNPKTNPRFVERLGINAVLNAGAIYMGDKYCLVVRVEGNDRKSFFAIAESENGIDNFRFRDRPILFEDTCPQETNVYDMRLTRHEDGWIYGVFCSESKDTSNPDLSAAVAAAGIVRTRDLVSWERLPNLVTKRSPQQRNVVLHPEFVNGKYAFYTRPMDDFIETGSGGGIGFGLCKDITHAVIDEEKMTSLRRYHQITEAKNGEGAVPIRTDRGWIHIAHGVRNTAAGLRYVLYAFATDLHDPSRVIAEPGGLLLGPRRGERVGDVSNVVFSNGCIARDNGDVYLYYAGSDTRLYVATTTIDRLTDYVFNTPPDADRSVLCVRQRIGLIERNLKYLQATEG